MKHKNSFRYVPFLLAICLVGGILIGNFYTLQYSGNRLNIINTGTNKINDLLRIIDDQYVDTVNMPDLIEKAMPRIQRSQRQFLRNRCLIHHTRRHHSHHQCH